MKTYKNCNTSTTVEGSYKHREHNQSVYQFFIYFWILTVNDVRDE